MEGTFRRRGDTAGGCCAGHAQDQGVVWSAEHPAGSQEEVNRRNTQKKRRHSRRNKKRRHSRREA